MRGPRILLVVCLAVGLFAVSFAARAQLREVTTSLERDRLRTARADLARRAHDLRDALADTLENGPVTAYYNRSGRLVWPAPPTTARRYTPPTDSNTALYLRLGQVDRALAAARTSADRAAALLRLGYERKDAGQLQKALAEEALQGTDMSYRARLEIFRLEERRPDAKWVDDVSALLDGRSDRFARSLLKEAGATPVRDHATRRELAAIRPRRGYHNHGGYVVHFAAEGNRYAMRRLAIGSVGSGSIRVPLAEPFEAITVRGEIDRAALQAQVDRWKLRIAGFYGLAGLILVVGTVYAVIALGRAHKLAAAKSDFVANVTHELKTPLANIRLYAESLHEGRVRTEHQTEFLETILEEAGRLDALVEGLLHAARGPKLERQPIDAAALLREAGERWRPRLERDGFELELDAPALPTVQGDKEALLRALDNLLDNARKYSRKDKRVRLAGAAANGHVRLTVADRGPGIPAQDRQRVLRPFARLESADRKETPGTGLGLSLVVSCMDAHGGRLEIGAAPGGGAAVSLILPVEGS